jgi:hypothetical protein
MFIYRLIQALNESAIQYALVGGYAIALHGVVRGTVDVDLVVTLSKKDFVAIERVLLSLGLESRLPVTAEEVFNFREEYIRNRNLIAWSFCNPKKPSETVDVLLSEDVGNIESVQIPIGSIVAKVASIEDLIRMKQKAGRAQDLVDIEALQKIQKIKQ